VRTVEEQTPAGDDEVSEPMDAATIAPARPGAVETSFRNRAEAGARLFAAILLVGAGAFHLLYAPAHFEEGHDVGLFFVLVGANQIAAGLLILAVPSLLLTLATLGGTLGVVGVYVASRTTGLPLGPNPGKVEAVGVYDLVTTFLEVAALPLLFFLVWLEWPARDAGGAVDDDA
jgi:hypothetical protein